MSSKAHADRLSTAIDRTGLAKPVKSAFAEGRVNVLCRVSAGGEAKWTDLLRRILMATEAEEGEVHSWQAHICRHYFLVDGEKGERKMVFGWNVSIQSQNMSDSLDVLMRVIKGEPIRTKANNDVDEIELTGVTGERGVAKRPGARGVFTIGGTSDFKPTGAR